MTQEKNKYKFNSAAEQKLYDVNAKLDIARRVVVDICLAQVHCSTSVQKIIANIAFQYFPPEIVNKLFAKLSCPKLTNSTHKTFNYWSEQASQRDFIVENDTIDTVSRDIIVKYYIDKKTLLNKRNFVKELITACPYWNVCDVDTYMKTRGYKSKRLPRCSKSIIIEDPERRFARMKYLQSMEQYRKSGTHIVYIDYKIAIKTGCFLEKLFRENVYTDELTQFHRAVSSSMGMISNKITKTSQCSNSGNIDDLYTQMTKWILETVALYISTPSVFVLEDHYQKNYEETPTMYSRKTEMINWLVENDIPHTSNMHTAELFELIKKSNRNLFKTKNILDETLMSYGHKVLRRPRRTHYLNFFNIIWKTVSYKPISDKIDLFNKTSLCNWKEFEITLNEIEQQTLKDDIEVNSTIKKLFTYAKHEVIHDDSLQGCDDFIDDFKMEDIVKINYP